MKSPNRGSDDDRYFYGISSSGEVVSDDYLPTLKLSQRAFGWQYPKQYSVAFKEFSDSYSIPSNNVVMSGFAVSIDETRFLLIPTLDNLRCGCCSEGRETDREIRGGNSPES